MQIYLLCRQMSFVKLLYWMLWDDFCRQENFLLGSKGRVSQLGVQLTFISFCRQKISWFPLMLEQKKLVKQNTFQYWTSFKEKWTLLRYSSDRNVRLIEKFFVSHIAKKSVGQIALLKFKYGCPNNSFGENFVELCLIFFVFHNQVHESLQRIRERKLVNFIEWGPASIQVCLICGTDFRIHSIPFPLIT